MVWSIDTDDFNGDCAILHQHFLDPLMGLDYPLMRTINIALAKSPTNYNENSLSMKKSSASRHYLNITMITILLILQEGLMQIY